LEAIGTLAGGIAHDFNNILSSIFGYTQLAQMHLASPEKAKNHMDQVLKGAQRAAALVQQILTFSRQTEYLLKASRERDQLFLYIFPFIFPLRHQIPGIRYLKNRFKWPGELKP
jgi:two-component system, cell cycle sensor histidine kinase and response regulator CckA